MKRINAGCYFSWQAQYFGEVEASLFVAGAALGDWDDSPSAKRCIFQ